MTHDDKRPLVDATTPAAQRLAQEIVRRRKAAGLSQADLATRTTYSPTYIARSEHPHRGLPSAELIRAIDTALNAGGTLIALQRQAKAEQNTLRDGLTTEVVATPISADVGIRRSAGADREIHFGQDGVAEVFGGRDSRGADPSVIVQLRRVIAATDMLADGPIRALPVLDRAVGELVEQRLDARYEQMAASLPELLAELLRAQQTATPADRRQLAQVLTAAYRAADGLAFKYGYLDLSARLIDLMRAAAIEADDPVLLASVAYVRTETFFATGDLDTALRALIVAGDDLRTNDTSDVSAIGTYGSLHMRAAVVAARSGRSDQASDHLAVAEQAAARVPEGVYHGTAFGPASVAVHGVAVALELGDSPSAIERAGQWQPPRELPAERRSHFYIDLGRANLDVGRYEDAYGALRTARQIAPQHARTHPRVQASLAALLKTPLGRDSEVVNYATWLRPTIPR